MDCAMADERASAFDNASAFVPMTQAHRDFYQGREWTWYERYARPFVGCQRVLDLGCGPGLLLEALARLGVPEAVGLERDPGFVEMCRARGVTCIEHDLNLPYPFLETESFDGVISFQVFDYLVDLAKKIALHEAWRVLRPGGRVAIYSQSRHKERAAQDSTRVGRTSPSELAALLREAGFEEISLADNALAQVPGSASAEVRREWLESGDYRLCLTANAVACKPRGAPRQEHAPRSYHSFLELWGGQVARRAWGKAPTCWRRANGSPVLSPGDGRWDRLSVRDATLLTSPGKESVRIAGCLVVFYSAYGGDPAQVERSVGRAESEDGLAWKRRPDHPVLEAGSPGDWDDGGVAAGSVVPVAPGRYLMYYSGRNQDGRFLGIGLAESEDTAAWRKLPSNPILTVDDYGDLRHLALADVFLTSLGTWIAHMEGWSLRQNGFRVYQAQGESPDSLRPTAGGSWVLGVVPGTWESHHVANPKCLEVSPGEFLMAYNGATAALDFQLGLAVSRDLLTWERVSSSPVLSKGYPTCHDGYRIESGFMLADEVREGSPRMWYFGSDTRSTTVGCHVLLAETQPEERVLDWERWRSARPSLYGLHSAGLRVLPGVTDPAQGLHTDLGHLEESLLSLAWRCPSAAAGGHCALGPAGEAAWLRIGTDGTIQWQGQEPDRLTEGADGRPSLCVQLKARRGRTVVALNVWTDGKLVHRAERAFPPSPAPLRFACWSAPEGPTWSVDHLLYLHAEQGDEG